MSACEESPAEKRRRVVSAEVKYDNGDDSVDNGDAADKTKDPTNKNKQEPTSTATNSDKDTVLDEKTPAVPEKCGVVLYCGTANWDRATTGATPAGAQNKGAGKGAAAGKGRGKGAAKAAAAAEAARQAAAAASTVMAPDCLEPHRLGGALLGVPIRLVATGPMALHCFCVAADGRVFGFGRNKFGQLGLGKTGAEVASPTLVRGALAGVDVVQVACGRTHSLFQSRDGQLWSCGDNRSGQLGLGSLKSDKSAAPAPVYWTERAVQVSCGADFSAALDTSGTLWTWGHPEHGQLGLGMSSSQVCKGGTKIVFDYRPKPAPAREFLIEEDARAGVAGARRGITGLKLVHLCCGANHGLVLDDQGRVWSWGWGGLGRLGHNSTRDESRPRLINFFAQTKRPVRSVHAGGAYNMAVTQKCGVFFWGQQKSTGDATMYPKTMSDFDGWDVHSVSCGNVSCSVIADEQVVAWGGGGGKSYGELGYGPTKQKTSAKPQIVHTLDSVNCFQSAMGYGQCLYLATADSDKDKNTLESKFPLFDRSADVADDESDNSEEEEDK